MELDLEKKEQQKEEEATSQSNKRKKVIFWGVALGVVVFASVGAFLILKPKLDEFATRGVKVPTKIVIKPKEKAVVKKAKEEKKNIPKEVRFEVVRDVFKEFYTKKFVAQVRKEIEERLKKEYERKIKSLKVLRNSPPPLEEMLMKSLKVYAIVCNSECVAYTDKGVFRNGDFFQGMRVIIDENGVSFKRTPAGLYHK